MRKQINGYEGYYDITDFGIVYSVKTTIPCEIKLEVMKLGYIRALLCKKGLSKRILVHVLVAEHFLEPRPDGHEVNHIDGNKANNQVSNLEWKTKSQNILHSYRVLGRKAYQQKTKPVLMMDLGGNIIAEYISINEASRQTKISAGNVHGAVNGRYKTFNGFKFCYK